MPANPSGNLNSNNLLLPAGWPRLKWIQEQVIQSLLAKQDTIGLLPTGTGKSLCYQAPAILLQAPTLVISPLLALMQDQVSGLQAKGIQSFCWNSLSGTVNPLALERSLERNQTKLLYLSPEKLQNPTVFALVTRIPWGVVAVDEAHCITAWGESFRPHYLSLGKYVREIKEQTGASRFVCTATATPATFEAICQHLQLENPTIIAQPNIRPNLHLAVAHPPNPQAHFSLLFRLLQHWWQSGTGTALVYVSSRHGAETLAQKLKTWGLPAQAFHAGLGVPQKRKLIAQFSAPQRSLFVATCALGMGVDQPCVRLVVHAESPTDIESYAQEVGRAGRDGAPAQAILLYQKEKLLETVEHRRQSNPQRWTELRKQAQVMRRLAEGKQCLTRALLELFQAPGVPPACVVNCGCSRCTQWHWRLYQS